MLVEEPVHNFIIRKSHFSFLMLKVFFSFKIFLVNFANFITLAMHSEVVNFINLLKTIGSYMYNPRFADRL